MHMSFVYMQTNVGPVDCAVLRAHTHVRIQNLAIFICKSSTFFIPERIEKRRHL